MSNICMPAFTEHQSCINIAYTEPLENLVCEDGSLDKAVNWP